MTDQMDPVERADLLKIGEFARLADTNLRTLRYYEELGLLQPADRSPGGFRFYRKTDVNRVFMIRDLQELGLNLEKINELISVRENLGDRGLFIQRVRRALTEHSGLLEERMNTLADQKRRVDLALQKTADCEDCTHTPGTDNNHCEPCVRTGDALPQLLSALY